MTRPASTGGDGPGLARGLVRRAVRPVYRRRVYRWSWKPADGTHPDVALPEGCHLTEGTEADLPLLGQLDAECPGGRDLLAAGHRLWLVRQGDTLVFSSWSFVGSAPTDASPTGWIELPPGFVMGEDVNTHPAFRGRGVVGAASKRISAQLVREGLAERFVGYILQTNSSSRRAAVKGGMREFAVVDVRKVGVLRDSALWRARDADRPGTLSTLRWSRPEPAVGTSPGDAEMFGWLQAAVRVGVPGPAGAVAPASSRREVRQTA